ncbi:MAG: hypothetical protein U0325_35000 [Polyangiales bacterium]
MRVRADAFGSRVLRGWLLSVALCASACGGVAASDPGDAAVRVDDDASSASDSAREETDGALADGAMPDRATVDGAMPDVPGTDVAFPDVPFVDSAAPDVVPTDVPPDASGCLTMGCASGTCSLRLDIDVPVATLSGRLTLGGAPWPMTSTNSGTNASAAARFYLRAQDTRALHQIAAIRYGNTSPFSRAAGSDAYATTTPPGTYDLVYRRGEGTGEVAARFNNDPVINGDRVLRTVTVTSGAQTLNIDVPVATLSGRLTLGGATWPMTSTNSGAAASAAAGFYLRAQDTQALHQIAAIRYGNTSPYSRAAGSDAYATTVLPGTYDLVYRRGESGGDVAARFNNDPVINGYRVLRTVTITAGAQTLDIDVPVTTLTGRLTQGGSTWPMTSTNSGAAASAAAGFYLRAQDTRALHQIASIRYGNTSPYSRAAGSDAYATIVLPGTYDLVYQRGEGSGEVSARFNGDPVINGYRVLRTVTITPGMQTLDVDVPVTTLTGRLTLGGATWPMTSTNSGINASAAAGFYLRAQDTQALHQIASIRYGNTSPFSRAAGSDAYATTVLPGTYDLVYRRGESGGEVSARFNNDPVINGYRVLRTVTITPGAQVLNVDLPVVNLSGRLTLAGSTWPMTSPNSGINASAAARFFLRAPDTFALHQIAAIRYGNTLPFSRAAGSDAYATTVLPGAYELVYQRGESGEEVAAQFNGDPVVNGYRVLQSCVRVP